MYLNMVVGAGLSKGSPVVSSCYVSTSPICYLQAKCQSFLAPSLISVTRWLLLFYLTYSLEAECFKVLLCHSACSKTFSAVSLLGHCSTVCQSFPINPCVNNLHPLMLPDYNVDLCFSRKPEKCSASQFEGSQRSLNSRVRDRIQPAFHRSTHPGV